MEVDFIRKATRKLAELQVKHPAKVLLAAFLFTVIILPGMTLVYFDNDNENFLPENDPVVESLFIVGSDFQSESGGGAQIIFFSDKNPVDEKVPSFDLRDPEFLKSIDRIDALLETNPAVLRVESPSDAVKAANNGRIPDDIDSVKSSLKNSSALTLYNDSFSIMRLSVVLNSFGSTDREYELFFDEMNSIVESVPLPSSVRFTVWGDFLQFIELQANSSSDLATTTGLAFLGIFLLIFFFYRSWTFAILAIIPIVISLLWTIGTMGYIDLPFTVLTTGFIPLVMGLGIDFSIHLIHHIRHLRESGKKIEDAIIETMETSGESITSATITTSIGFFSLILASLLVTQRLGVTLTLAVIYIYLGCMIMVPPVVLLQDRLFNKTQQS